MFLLPPNTDSAEEWLARVCGIEERWGKPRGDPNDEIRELLRGWCQELKYLVGPKRVYGLSALLPEDDRGSGLLFSSDGSSEAPKISRAVERRTVAMVCEFAHVLRMLDQEKRDGAMRARILGTRANKAKAERRAELIMAAWDPLTPHGGEREAAYQRIAAMSHIPVDHPGTVSRIVRRELKRRKERS